MLKINVSKAVKNKKLNWNGETIKFKGYYHFSCKYSRSVELNKDRKHMGSRTGSYKLSESYMG